MLLNLRFQLEILDPTASKVGCAEIDKQWIACRHDRNFARIVDVNFRKRVLPEVFQDLLIGGNFGQVFLMIARLQSIQNWKTQSADGIGIQDLPFDIELIDFLVNPRLRG